MKLATLKKGGRDGTLVVVNRALTHCRAVPAIARSLQAALDDWEAVEPQLRQVYEALNSGAFTDPDLFDPAACHSPLPRAYQWADGSAYVNHVELVRRARGAELPPEFWTDPLMYQGGSDSFVGPRDAIQARSEDWGIDLEAEVAVITGDVRMGAGPTEAGKATFGPPRLMSHASVTWDLERTRINLSKRTPEFITVTVWDTKLEQLADSGLALFPAEPKVAKTVVHGGPYFLKGFRPGPTRRVQLTEGVYLLTAQHQGDGNFIAYLYTPVERELVANEIDDSYTCTTIHVDEPVEEVFFVVEHAGGPWEIKLKKMDGVAP